MAKEMKKTNLEMFNDTLEFLKGAGAPAELVEFMASRVAQDEKARATAKAKRAEKNGGEKKDPSQSEFYTNLRESLSKFLSTKPQTGDELVALADAKTSTGKAVLAAQVATALKPLVEDGTVVTEMIKVNRVDKNGLAKESMRKAYRFA